MKAYAATPIAAALIVAFGLGACSSGASTDDTAAGPSVTITSPAEGATVMSPFQVCMAATGLTIEPSGDVHPNAGHFHVLVDVSADEKAALEAGEPGVVAKDATHIHVGDGTECASVEAAAGPHTLTALVADGAHTNLNPPVMTTINVTVATE